MSWSDPIADMLTRIRNAQRTGHRVVEFPASRLKGDIARVLKSEGYIADYGVEPAQRGQVLRVVLRYAEGDPVIRGLKRESKPGLRRYCGSREIPRVLGGLGIAILSTSGGVMSGREARRRRLGGELICSIW